MPSQMENTDAFASAKNTMEFHLTISRISMDPQNDTSPDVNLWHRIMLIQKTVERCVCVCVSANFILPFNVVLFTLFIIPKLHYSTRTVSASIAIYLHIEQKLNLNTFLVLGERKRKNPVNVDNESKLHLNLFKIQNWNRNSFVCYFFLYSQSSLSDCSYSQTKISTWNQFHFIKFLLLKH